MRDEVRGAAYIQVVSFRHLLNVTENVIVRRINISQFVLQKLFSGKVEMQGISRHFGFTPAEEDDGW